MSVPSFDDKASGLYLTHYLMYWLGFYKYWLLLYRFDVELHEYIGQLADKLANRGPVRKEGKPVTGTAFSQTHTPVSAVH